jgi:Flp pilus assembly pilin Flp
MKLQSFHKDETGQALVEYLLSVAVLTRAVISSIKNGISSIQNVTTHELVIGTCVLIVIAFVMTRLLGHNR